MQTLTLVDELDCTHQVMLGNLPFTLVLYTPESPTISGCTTYSLFELQTLTLVDELDCTHQVMLGNLPFMLVLYTPESSTIMTKQCPHKSCIPS